MLKFADAHSESLRGRIPYKMFINENGQLLFRWLYVGMQKFNKPFFDETISTCLSLPENSFQPMPVTTAETLIQIADAADSVAPAAFIFHISRCGSTLMSQMLCQEEEFIALSEVPLLDDLLRLPYLKAKFHCTISPEELYAAVLRLLGQKRTSDETHLFVKADSWHLLFYERIREVFPAIPKVILYRTPEEVMYSHRKLPGIHMVKGVLPAELFGFEAEKINLLTGNEYGELILETYYSRILSILNTDPFINAVGYHKGPMTMLYTLLGTAGIALSKEKLSFMEKRTLKHSKNSLRTFAPDPIQKLKPETKLYSLFIRLNELAERKGIVII